MKIIKRPLATALLLALSTTAGAGNFNRIATFNVADNLPEGSKAKTKTVAEIVVAANKGNTLVYTDSKLEAIGYVDITNAAAPKAAGIVKLSGEPTSVAVKGTTAYAGVNTSKSYVEPAGHVAVINNRKITAKCDVKGQPDSVAISPDGKYLAIAIENERDEDLNDGIIPQMPAGHLAVFELAADGAVKNCNKAIIVDMTGFAGVAPSDPEPEFVDINDNNIAVVTLQENNHIALVDLKTGKVIKNFSAGATSMSDIDSTKGDHIYATGSIKDKAREPDAVVWLNNELFATADEGDYEGGSRTFTVFNTKGEVVFDSGNSMEHMAVSYGHFPKGRAHKKGTEPEGITTGKFGGNDYIFVGLERAGLMAAYKVNGKKFELVQGIPAGWRPEGIKAISDRNLLVVANEKDKPKKGARSTIMIYNYSNTAATYPHIKSDNLIGWGALSGMAGDINDANIVYTVNDSFYKAANIYTVDVSAKPARITAVTKVNEKNLDLEGIAQDADGTFWVASEGKPADKKKNTPEVRKNRILHIDTRGNVIDEIKLPELIMSQVKRFGLEGITVDGDKILVVFQREWQDDPEGFAKIGEYNRKTRSWGFYHYPLGKPESSRKAWVGLSEITTVAPSQYMVIERDNQRGVYAMVKRVFSVDTNGIKPGTAGSELPKLKKTLVKDVLSDMRVTNGWTPDKIEGLAFTKDGRFFLSTDNDGVDGNGGETLFWEMKK